MNIRPTLGALLLGCLYLNVLHIVLVLALALALDIALGAMLLLILVMVIGIALIGDILAAFVLASEGSVQAALGDLLSWSTLPIQMLDAQYAKELQVNGLYTSNGTVVTNHSA